MRQLLLLLLLIPAAGLAQYRVTLIVEKVPAGTKADRLYVSGNFNYWEPADENAALYKNNDDKYEKVFDNVPAGLYEFKVTAGSNESIEVAEDGKDIPNRVLDLSSDTTIRISVARWKNDKAALTENISLWSGLQLPFYNSTNKVKKQDGAILRYRKTLLKS
jgi:hypothetical protein